MTRYIIFHSKARDLRDNYLPKETGRLLSNFDGGSVIYHGLYYPSVEHAFQAQKYLFTTPPSPDTRLEFTDPKMSAVQAKEMGGKIYMKKLKVALDIEAWNRVSESLMRELIVLKIHQNPIIRDILIYCSKNGIRLFHFSRSDMKWGCHVDSKTGDIIKGSNLLGRLYEEFMS